ncbi:hypothetical protein D3C87_1523190 [compost metagenome]
METKNAVSLGRYVFCLIDDASKVVVFQRDPEKRVGFLPTGRIRKWIIVFIQSANVRKRRVVDSLADIREIIVWRLSARRNFHRVLVLVPANAVPVRTRVGNHEKQRLTTELEAALKHLDDLTIWMLVNFIAKRDVRSRT